MLSPTLVLTAAHCLYGSSGALFNIATNQPAAGGQITFSTGSVISSTAGVPRNITYSAPVDAVGVYSAYNPNVGGSPGIVDPVGDIALLRLNIADPSVLNPTSAPTSFLPIYSGTGELANPPNIATAVGYGLRGDGLRGQVAGSDGVKQAGLTLLDAVTNSAGATVSSDKLSARFNSPGAFGQASSCTTSSCSANDPRLLPTNFLQAGIASGDSGGPLLMNIANAMTGTVTNSIIGVASYNNGDIYGSRDVWTRVSTYAAWILSESAALTLFPPSDSAGTNITNPFAPTQVTTVAGTVVQRFTNFVTAALAYFFDPPASQTTEIQQTSGPAFSSIFVPADLGSSVELWLYDAASSQYYDTGISIATGAWYDFGSSLTRFELVSPTVNESGSEIFGFKFADSGTVDFSTSTFVTAQTGTGSSGSGGEMPSSVPEPPATAIAMIALLMVFCSRAKCRNQGGVPIGSKRLSNGASWTLPRP